MEGDLFEKARMMVFGSTEFDVPDTDDPRVKELGDRIGFGTYGSGKRGLRADFYERGFVLAWNEYKKGGCTHKNAVATYENTNKPGMTTHFNLFSCAVCIVLIIISLTFYKLAFLPACVAAVLAYEHMCGIQMKETILIDGHSAVAESYSEYRFIFRRTSEIKSFFSHFRGKVNAKYDNMIRAGS